MSDARGRRNARPAGPGQRRGRGRVSPSSPGRGRGGPGPARASRRPAGAAGREQAGTAARRDGKDVGARDSSAAKATDRAARGRRSALTGRAAILALVLAALIVSYASSLRAWSEQQARLADLRAEASDRDQRVADLEQELDRWQDPAYVEAQARQRFGWVMPGEVGYVVVDEDDPAPRGPSSGVAGGAAGRQPVWWRDLWGSVERAGAPPKPARSAKPKPAATIDPERSTKPPESR
jgi:cell division protein FtsB